MEVSLELRFCFIPLYHAAIISIWEYFPESSPERASLVAQTVRNSPAIQETFDPWVQKIT